MISPDELQRLLREFGGGLALVTVEVPHPVLAPATATIRGVANINGQPKVFEAEGFDLRKIIDADDVLGLARQFLESFQAAERRLPQTH